MSDKLSYDELAELLRQLQDQDLEAIGRRLGLNLHDPQRPGELERQLRDSAVLRERVHALALSYTQQGRCSFCRKQATKLVTSPTGTSICAACLQRMG